MLWFLYDRNKVWADERKISEKGEMEQHCHQLIPFLSCPCWIFPLQPILGRTKLKSTWRCYNMFKITKVISLLLARDCFGWSAVCSLDLSNLSTPTIVMSLQMILTLSMLITLPGLRCCGPLHPSPFLQDCPRLNIISVNWFHIKVFHERNLSEISYWQWLGSCLNLILKCRICHSFDF